MADNGKVDPFFPIGPVIIWSDVKYTNDEIQGLCDQVRQEVTIISKKDYKEFKAVFYRKSEEIILNYIIKVYDGDDYLHLSIGPIASIRDELMVGLKGMQEGHKWNDPLEPFNYR